MHRFLILIFGIFAYALGMNGLIYFILFVGGWDFLPFHVDSKTPGPFASALVVNLGLITLFGVQHSVMARRSFKQVWTKVIPKAAERSSYSLASGIVLFLLCFYWKPIPGTLWHIENQIAQTLLISVQLSGWTFAVMATFVISHFELFGLQQVYFNFVNRPEPPSEFTEVFPYKIVRHPIQLGLLIGLWSTANMSMTHLMLSISITVYTLIGLYYEEKDLVASWGKDYQDYRQRVPKIIPLLMRRLSKP